MNSPVSRPVTQIIEAQTTREGAGMVIRRAFPNRALDRVDPFLLLDHFGPADHAPGEAKGAPDHPHRGFETVTYLIDGEMEHRDSTGRSGRLGPGDVQWMTAGAGVIHSEMPSERIRREGGRVHGFQLWVNLPQRDKLTPPRYQEIPAAAIPTGVNTEGTVTAKVIAGEAYGAISPVETRTPILYLHMTVRQGESARQPIPAGYRACAYVVSGSGGFGPALQWAGEGSLALFGDEDGPVEFKAGPDLYLDFLLLAGKPLGEPVARYGPFVMNTQQEIMEAIRDFQSGRMGRIVP